MHFTKLIMMSVLLLLPFVSEAKKRCKPLLEKLHNIQAMQRTSYSSKRGSSLRAREDKARDKWWQCEQGKGAKRKGKKKKKTKNKGYKKRNSYKPLELKTTLRTTPFKTQNAVVIKSKYQGDKKRAWLKFYQQPAHCNRPKNLSVFASCSEDKQLQRINFEQGYKASFNDK